MVRLDMPMTPLQAGERYRMILREVDFLRISPYDMGTSSTRPLSTNIT